MHFIRWYSPQRILFFTSRRFELPNMVGKLNRRISEQSTYTLPKFDFELEGSPRRTGDVLGISKHLLYTDDPITKETATNIPDESGPGISVELTPSPTRASNHSSFSFEYAEGAQSETPAHRNAVDESGYDIIRKDEVTADDSPSEAFTSRSEMVSIISRGEEFEVNDETERREQ